MAEWWISANAEAGSVLDVIGHAFVVAPDPIQAAICIVLAGVFFWAGREIDKSMPGGPYSFFLGTVISSEAALLVLLPGKLQIFLYPALSVVVAIIVWFGILGPREKNAIGSMAKKLWDVSRRARGRFRIAQHDK